MAEAAVRLRQNDHGWTALLLAQPLDGMGCEAGDSGRNEDEPNFPGLCPDPCQRGFRCAQVLAHMPLHAREGKATDIVRIADDDDPHDKRPKIMMAMISP